MNYYFNYIMNILNIFLVYTYTFFSAKFIAQIDFKKKRLIYLNTLFIPYDIYIIFYNLFYNLEHFYIENDYYYCSLFLKENYINPIIINAKAIDNNEVKDILDILLKYENVFPLWVVLKNEGLTNYNKLIITKNKLFTDITKEIDIISNLDKTLNEIYKM